MIEIYLFIFTSILLFIPYDISSAQNFVIQHSTEVKKIAIDPGFGGKDFGPSGCNGPVYAKNINLELSNKLKKLIQEKLNIEVIMTRETDQYRTLEERTAIANTKGADIFISIHTNASQDKRAYGIETYFLNMVTDPESINIAAEQNETSHKNTEGLNLILTDLMKNTKIEDSKLLANKVQESLCNHLASKYTHIGNRGVKEAPFYILLGAQMPAIMIQTSFITNQRECERLKSEKYQDNICYSIVRGIQQYIEEIDQ